MISNPRQLRPGELLKLLNSTPLGEVIGERQLLRHRNQAGYRIGDGRTVDLFRYVAWLAAERHGRLAKAKDGLAVQDAYEAQKERSRARSRKQSESVREIGDLPAVVDPARKALCRDNFRLFCEIYFPARFGLAWSPDHLRVIARIEEKVRNGGLVAIAMPRGSGKTSLAEVAVLWATMFGHRHFVVLIGADKEHAQANLEALQAELQSNELLRADFPEVCYPIEKLEGITQRARSQLYKGQQTHVRFGKGWIVLPTIAGSAASGNIIRVVGITGSIRGMKFTRPDGKSVRPDFVVPDDVQTDASARSPTTVKKTIRVLNGAVLGLAGPGTKISGVMPCTVIVPDDQADQMLDRKRHSDWQGERCKALYAFPERMDLWEQYWEIRAAHLEAGGDGSQGTEFYRENRDEMDRGAEVAWPQRFNPDELSGLQNALNYFFADRFAFYAERQNEPLREEAADSIELKPVDVAARTNGYERRQVPDDCPYVTLGIDVHGELLYYSVCAWEPNFTGYVLDYGTYPEQNRPSFTLRDAKVTLMSTLPEFRTREERVGEGVRRLIDKLCTTKYTRESSGLAAPVNRGLVDRGYLKDVIYRVIQSSAHAGVIMPSKGFGILAKDIPFSERKRAKGERVGPEWKIPNVAKTRAGQYVQVDTNHWKSFLFDRLQVGIDGRTALTLWGEPGDRPLHLHFAEHLTSEYYVEVTAKGRTIKEWHEKANRDNHWLDTIIMNYIAASMLGVQMLGVELDAPRKRTRRRFSAEDAQNIKRVF